MAVDKAHHDSLKEKYPRELQIYEPRSLQLKDKKNLQIRFQWKVRKT